MTKHEQSSLHDDSKIFPDVVDDKKARKRMISGLRDLVIVPPSGADHSSITESKSRKHNGPSQLQIPETSLKSTPENNS